ncbi:MAG: hypothetical protein ACRCSN_20645 [Dermatophilaceae bacterium]
MNTPAERADVLLGQARTVGQALETYADALAVLHAKQAVLATDIAGFYADKAEANVREAREGFLDDVVEVLSTSGPAMAADEGVLLLVRENDLTARVEALQAAKDEAERVCANTIGALWGAEPFEASDQATVGDDSVYGLSAQGYAELTRAGDAPWGRPDSWDSDNWAVRKAMLTMGAAESVTGTIGFFGDLFGQGEDGSAAAAWSGLGQLATDSLRFASLPILAVSARTDPDGTQQAADRLKEVGKNTIGWDTWDTSGWYTSGGLGLDVALTAATWGAGGAAKGSVRGAAATRFTRLLEAAGDTGLDIRTAAAAARLRLNTTLTARLDHLTTLGDDLSDHLDALRPATPGVPTSRTVLDNHVMRHEPAALGHGHPGQTVDGTGDAANPHTPPDQHASEPDNRGPEQPEGASESPAVDPAQQQRIADLARDPAEGGKIDADTIAEAEVGLALEERGDVSGLRRSPHEGAEFIDADGNAWDVKPDFAQTSAQAGAGGSR